MTSGEWYVVPSGEHAGQWHMAGWRLSAHLGVPSGSRDDGWLAFGCCPRCHAMVLNDDRGPYGDLTWAHEQWHARTDYPVPADPPGESCGDLGCPIHGAENTWSGRA